MELLEKYQILVDFVKSIENRSCDIYDCRACDAKMVLYAVGEHNPNNDKKFVQEDDGA